MSIPSVFHLIKIIEAIFIYTIPNYQKIQIQQYINIYLYSANIDINRDLYANGI